MEDIEDIRKELKEKRHERYKDVLGAISIISFFTGLIALLIFFCNITLAPIIVVIVSGLVFAIAFSLLLTADEPGIIIW